jgi:hypothetical protein
LPVPFVLKLHVSKDRKVSIMSMFLLGGLYVLLGWCIFYSNAREAD